MFAVHLCPTRNKLFLTTVKGLWITYHQVCAVCEAMRTHGVDGQAQTLLLTRVANLPPPANTKHSGKSMK